MYSNKDRWYINQQIAYAMTCPMLVEDQKLVKRAQYAMKKAETFFKFLNNFWENIKNLSDIRCSYEYFKDKLKYLETQSVPPFVYLKTNKMTRKRIQWIEFDPVKNETNIYMEFVLPNPYLAYRNNNAFLEFFKDRTEEEGWIPAEEGFYKRANFADVYLILDGFAGASGFPNFFLMPFVKIRWDYEISWNRP